MKKKILFVYLGRRGAIVQLSLEMAAQLQENDVYDWSMLISNQNEQSADYKKYRDRVFFVDTFSNGFSMPFNILNIIRIRRFIARHIRENRIDAVITLMPHIWSPLISSIVRAAGSRYVTIVHDAVSHTGDKTGIVTSWLLRDTRHADLIITLSEKVAGQLESIHGIGRGRLFTIQHPDFTFGKLPIHRTGGVTATWRILFFGRILPYKGLQLLLDAVSILKKDGIKLELGVYGSGDISAYEQQLRQLDAYVENRWFKSSEIPEIFLRYDAIVVSHIESSQSGVVASALGCGLPIIATPVGGLREQIIDGVTGVFARSAESHQLSLAIKRLFQKPDLYQTICRNIVDMGNQRSMGFFVDDVVSHSLYAVEGSETPTSGNA